MSRALCEAAAFAADEMGTKVTAGHRIGTHGPETLINSPRAAHHRTHARPEVMSELSLIWAVEPLLIKHAESTEEMLKIGEQRLLEAGVVERGEVVVIMAGRLSGLGARAQYRSQRLVEILAEKAVSLRTVGRSVV